MDSSLYKDYILTLLFVKYVSDKLGKGKEIVDKLSELLGIFRDQMPDFSKNHADGDDIIGDAYEYLMLNFATESGKSKGQFYTPAEVFRILTKVVGIEHAKAGGTTLYDPAESRRGTDAIRKRNVTEVRL